MPDDLPLTQPTGPQRDIADVLQATLDGIPAMVAYWDRDMRNVVANAAYVEYFGHQPGEMTGMTIRELLGDELFERNRTYIEGALAGESQLFDRELVDATGRPRCTQAQYIPDIVDGEVRGFFALVADVTERVEAESAASRGVSRLRSLIHNLPDGFVLLFDRELRFEVADGKALVMFGFDPVAVEGRTLRETFEPSLVAFLEPIYRSALAGETQTWGRDIGSRSFQLTAGPVRDERGEVFGGTVVCIDVTAERRAAAFERTLHEMARTVAANVPLPEVAKRIVDRLHEDLGLTLATVVRFDGPTRGEVLATSRRADFLGPNLEFDAQDRTATARVATTGEHATVVFDPTHSGTSAAAYAAGLRGSVASPIYVRGELWGSIGVSTDDLERLDDDVTDRLTSFADLVGIAIANTNAWEALTERAETDTLTRLPNRESFDQRLRLAIHRCRETGDSLALAVVDVDHFKTVNDTFGHPVGDRALIHVAELLRTTIRDGETVARIGGEEFAWILPETVLASARRAAERTRRTVAANEVPGVGRLTVSVGIAGLTDRLTPEELLARADGALYEAKRQGRNRVVVADMSRDS